MLASITCLLHGQNQQRQTNCWYKNDNPQQTIRIKIPTTINLMKINYYPRSKSISRSSKTDHQRNHNKTKTTMLPAAGDGRWYTLGGSCLQRWFERTREHCADCYPPPWRDCWKKSIFGMGSYTSLLAYWRATVAISDNGPSPHSRVETKRHLSIFAKMLIFLNFVIKKLQKIAANSSSVSVKIFADKIQISARTTNSSICRAHLLLSYFRKDFR